MNPAHGEATTVGFVDLAARFLVPGRLAAGAAVAAAGFLAGRALRGRRRRG